MEHQISNSENMFTPKLIIILRLITCSFVQILADILECFLQAAGQVLTVVL